MPHSALVCRLPQNSPFLFMLYVFMLPLVALAQPGNDECASASVIAVPGNGFGTGVIKSAEVSMAGAGIRPGEFFHSVQVSSGNDKKSVWFKLTLPTARAVKIELKQNGNAIPQADAGFTTYFTDACNQVTLAEVEAAKITPLNKFGNSYHPCLSPGQYLVQVGAKNTVAGSVFLEVTVENTAQINQYDLGKNAYDFGTVNVREKAVSYELGCQTIDDNTEKNCLPLAGKEKYTQSTWHTFTTDDHLDYLAVGFSSANTGELQNRFRADSLAVGLRLYKGNVRTTPVSGLTQTGNCEKLVFNGSISQSYLFPRKDYTCVLEPNTTYSVQLLFHQDARENVRVFVWEKGEQPSQGPVPVNARIGAANKLGVLRQSPEGVITAFADYLGCNGRLSVPANACGKANPAGGVRKGTTVYDLNSWSTFELAQAANVQVNVGLNYGLGYSGYQPVYARIFRQGVTENCADLDTNKVIGGFSGSQFFTCLPAGKYALQLLGQTAAPRHYNAHPYFSNLGDPVKVEIKVTEVNQFNRFSLTATGRYEAINGLKPLLNGQTYETENDRLGCLNTVLPAGSLCRPDITKAIYRVLRTGDGTGDAKADSGLVTISGLRPWRNGYEPMFSYRFYKGNVNALATAQGKFTHPDTITGLRKYSECGSNYVVKYCVTPGDYSFITLGGEKQVGEGDQPKVQYEIIRTRYHSRAAAENLGDITTQTNVQSGTDYFSCYDNPATIDGLAPCSNATKLIYRQFYLQSPRALTIRLQAYRSAGVGMTLFKGKATDPRATLKVYSDPERGAWQCFGWGNTPECYPLPAGWYTLVMYGTGASYGDPLRAQGNIGEQNAVDITLRPAANQPRFNRPYRASNVNEGKPLTWGGENSGTAAYPANRKSYTLETEWFGCADDKPFSKHPLAVCDTTFNRVAYYVFTLNQEAFVRITGVGQYRFRVNLFGFDVRRDSTRMLTQAPIQDCWTGTYSGSDQDHLQYCGLQPGTYTLVIFAGKQSVGQNVTPVVVVDNVARARFDYAAKAYDFALVPGDGQWYGGKVGERNPLNSERAASNDFLYCTTGAARTDPDDVNCGQRYNPNVYKRPYNAVLVDTNKVAGKTRRNLWYTFVAEGPGKVQIKVDPKTTGTSQPYFAVYRSDENGALPFGSLQATGKVDSTAAQGLELIVKNGPGYYCQASNSVTFTKTQCDQVSKVRYYVLVEQHPNDYPSQQVEVFIRFDGVPYVPVRYDHYSQANVINGLGQQAPPYADKALRDGKYTGNPASFLCATTSSNDQPCTYSPRPDNRTLWFKFKSAVGGRIRVALQVDGQLVNYSYNSLTLMREVVPGDSTAKGLSSSLGRYVVNNQNCYLASTYADNVSWGEACLYPGTYYIMLSDLNPATGQPYNIEKVTPVVWIVEQTGDRCSDAAPLVLTGTGTATASVNVDCHTIGTDFGEDGSNMGCLFGPEKYKSTWFRLQLNGPDKVDLSFRLNEQTNALASQIRYRVMYGDCSYMTAGPCNTDALTEFTLNCMKAEGNIYFVQVVTPAEATGALSLTVQTIRTLDQNCKPLDPLQPIANFRYQTTCDAEEVTFINQSTLGASMKYEWSFGVPGKTSTEISPRFAFPRTSAVQTFGVKLKVTNTSNNKSDEIIIPVQVLPRFAIAAGENQTICSGTAAFALTGMSPAGGTWSGNGVTAAGLFTPAAAGIGAHTLTYTATQEGCTGQATKTITVSPGTAVQAGGNLSRCANEPAFALTGMSPAGGTWSGKGVTAAGQFNPAAAGAGTHTLTYTLVQNGCSSLATRTITVSAAPIAQAGADQTVCVAIAAFTLTGMSPAGGTWSGRGVTAAGLFTPAAAAVGAHVLTYTVTQNGCTAAVGKTITVTAQPVVQAGAAQAVCVGAAAFKLTNVAPEGGTWSGKGVTAAGAFNPATAGVGSHTLTYTVARNGCTSTATKAVTVNALPVVQAGTTLAVCLDAPALTLAGFSPAGGIWSGKGVTATGQFNPATAGVGTHTLTYTVTQEGCTNTAATNVTVNALPVVKAGADQRVCLGPAVVTLSGYAPAGGVWSGKGINAKGAFDASAAGPGAHTVTYTVTRNGCSASASKVVTVDALPAEPVIKADGPTSFCSPASVVLAVSTGKETSYQWLRNGAPVGDNQSSFTATTSGVYTVAASNACGRSVSKPVTVTASPAPTPPRVQEASRCGPGPLTLRAGGAPEGSYRWYENATATQPIGGNAATGSSFTTPGLPGTTTYYVSAAAAGCESTRVPVAATILPLPVADAGPDASIREGQSIRLRASGGTRYEWWPATGLDNPNVAEPLASPAVTTVYHVTVRDDKGCEATGTVRVIVRNEVVVPNAFTPNGDGTNDSWEIANLAQYPNCKVEIFNRWGSKVYESRGYATPWDGTMDGKALPMTTYFYVIDLHDGTKPRVGPVSVIR